MSHITGAAALKNKYSGLLFEVVMLLYTSSEDLVISPLLLRTLLPRKFVR